MLSTLQADLTRKGWGHPVLMDFAFSQSLVDQIKGYLNSASTDLEGTTPAGTGGQSFGGSPASLGCAGDATKAQQKVKAAITDMCTGLQGYVDALQQMENRAYAVEDTTEAELNKHWATAEACQTPDIKSGGVCTPAGS